MIYIVNEAVQLTQAMEMNTGDKVTVVVYIDSIGEVLGYSGDCIEIRDVSTPQ